MTKLEAWQAWCSTAGTERLADEFTLENSSHGKAFSFAWDAAHEACAKVAESLWQQFQDTKDAHERLSPEPFMPGRFGFDQSTIQQSRRIADTIRARSSGV